ncbi:histone-like nucleoid-structuring protein Lsr2 [Pseudonocardia sp. ICBG1293]|uniref:Lsr2 dimerization domain-containing protein n=1 Tax=Pseudonocardia sp. ICBG1293 TaxID=2844382 RepID=UPI002108257F|nr:histone-like nucleoid-structuring protein Lsr2 [Pseudonocardia sp. ICBG1293]
MVDDLDGGSADETVEFTVDDLAYEIDLSRDHAVALREALAPYPAAARRTPEGAARARRLRTAASATTTARRRYTSAVRS